MVLELEKFLCLFFPNFSHIIYCPCCFSFLFVLLISHSLHFFFLVLLRTESLLLFRFVFSGLSWQLCDDSGTTKTGRSELRLRRGRQEPDRYGEGGGTGNGRQSRNTKQAIGGGGGGGDLGKWHTVR